VEFEWDAAKAESNVAKHGVDFDTAAEIFEDPNRLVIIDRRCVYGESGDRSLARTDLLRCIHHTRQERLPDHQRQKGNPS
jgi:uncharacterized DUF497 family protein